jgi:hypothetical protein
MREVRMYVCPSVMLRVTLSVERFARIFVFCSTVKESVEHLNAVAGMEEKRT